ncbi:MAG: SiaB family protein kinase [Bernardetiaceae bacterium]
MTADFKLHPFKLYLEQHHISFAFRGVMTQDVLALIGLTLRNGEKDRILSRRLFSIAVEMAQNIYHYSEEREYVPVEKTDVGCGIIVITQSDTFYRVTSGNLILRTKEESIAERCHFINQLTTQELQDYHRQQRRVHARLDSTSGANIGLIELVRRSGHPLETHFFDAEESPVQKFFTLSVTIDKVRS